MRTRDTLAVLISGRGSNMQSIVRACLDNTLPATVTAVVSNRPDAAGLDFARQNSIATHVVDHTQYSDRDVFDQALAEQLVAINADWIVLAGFMRILGEPLVSRFPGRMLNIHPSLLPKYPGLHTHRQVLEAGDREHGASVHFVTPELDAGPVILQARVPVYTDDTESRLAARVLEQEHTLFVDALRLCVTGQVRFQDGKCYRANDKD